MPNVRGNGNGHQGGQTHQSGQHTRDQINQTSPQAKARDDLKGAFAGEENNGPFENPKIDHESSTNVKSRVTETSKLRDHTS